MNAPARDPALTGRSDGGFTLVSLVVAIVLLSVGVLSISQLLAQSVSMQTSIELRTTALDVGRSYMEEVRIRNPLTLATEDPVTVDEAGVEDVDGIFTRSLTVTEVEDHLLQVTVTVDPRGTASPVVLTTLLWDGLIS